MAEPEAWAYNTESTEASVARRATAAQMGSPVGSFAGGISAVTAGGGHGVVGEGDLLVSQHAGTPGMSVDVAVGAAFIRGTTAADQGCYAVQLTAIKQVTIAAAHATLTRKDLIVARIRDAEYTATTGDVTGSFAIEVVAGTPSGSPVDPTVPPSSLVLARVTVVGADTSITNGEIADLRTWAAGLGGVQRCLSTLRPSGASLYEGLTIHEVDTGVRAVYDGAAWAPWLKFTGSGAVEIDNVTVLGAKDKVYSANVNGAVTIDAANGGLQLLTLTGNVTSITPSNFDQGESVKVLWIQDATGSRTTVFPAWVAVGGVASVTATIKTTANAVNIFELTRIRSAAAASDYFLAFGGDVKA